MTNYIFEPNYERIAQIKGLHSISDLAEEIGVYSATPEFVRKNCGKIANGILDNVPQWFYEEADELRLFPNIDIRIHELSEGDYPAYPGWHCDGDLREAYFAQPVGERIRVARNLIATVSTHEEGVSNTQFLNETSSTRLKDYAEESEMWAEVDRQLRSKSHLRVRDTSDGQMVCFDTKSLHRAMSAKRHGWRLFFRMSMWKIPKDYSGGNIGRFDQIYKTLSL